jgi:hypothetical protein
MFVLLMEAAHSLESVRAEYRRTFFVDRWTFPLTCPHIRTVRWTLEAIEAVRYCPIGR